MIIKFIKQFYIYNRIVSIIIIISLLVLITVFIIDMDNLISAKYFFRNNIEFFSIVLSTFSAGFLLLSIVAHSYEKIAIDTAIYQSGANRYMAFNFILDRLRAIVGISGLVISFSLNLIARFFPNQHKVNFWYLGTVIIIVFNFFIFCIIWILLNFSARKKFLGFFAEDLLNKELKPEEWNGSDSNKIWLERLGKELIGIIRNDSESIEKYYLRVRNKVSQYLSS